MAMTLLSVDAEGGKDQREALAGAAAGLRPGAPVLIMIHGFRYRPGVLGHCPHQALYAHEPAISGPRVISWPRHLGFREGRPSGMLGIGFGWDAGRTLWHAQKSARRAGRRLAELLAVLQEAAPEARVGLIAHSLGARVALSALPHLPAGAIDRAVLMAAAEFRGSARAALDTPAGRAVEVVNVTSRENDVFDLLHEASAGFTGRAVGRGLPAVRPNWVDVQIDDPAARAGLVRLGFRIAPPARRVCHWSAYLRPGVFALYRALLTDAEPLSISQLRAVLPRRQTRHWSRLLAPPAPPMLPLGGSA
jgi:hypothetical protein